MKNLGYKCDRCRKVGEDVYPRILSGLGNRIVCAPCKEDWDALLPVVAGQWLRWAFYLRNGRPFIADGDRS